MVDLRLHALMERSKYPSCRRFKAMMSPLRIASSHKVKSLEVAVNIMDNILMSVKTKTTG